MSMKDFCVRLNTIMPNDRRTSMNRRLYASHSHEKEPTPRKPYLNASMTGVMGLRDMAVRSVGLVTALRG